MQPGENMHGGHRERLKDRFISEGLEGFEEHNILELLLFYVIPQKDTNELAHSLLSRFGSLEGVFSADVEEMMQVEGVGEQTARFLGMFSDLMGAYMLDRQQNAIIDGAQNIIEFAVRKLAFSEVECLIICYIDNKQSMLNWHFIQEGYVTPELLDTKSMIRMMLGTNATYAILARNYLRKKTDFSKKDFTIIAEVSAALRKVGVKLYDYVVIGSDRSYKMLSNTPEVEHYKIFLN